MKGPSGEAGYLVCETEILDSNGQIKLTKLNFFVLKIRSF